MFGAITQPAAIFVRRNTENAKFTLDGGNRSGIYQATNEEVSTISLKVVKDLEHKIFFKSQREFLDIHQVGSCRSSGANYVSAIYRHNILNWLNRGSNE